MSGRTSTYLAIVGAVLLTTAGLLPGCSGSDSNGNSGPATITGKLLRAGTRVRLVARSTSAVPGSPIAGAEIIVDGAPSGLFTDTEGDFTLTLNPGTHTVAVNTGGANSQSMTIVVEGTTAMTVEFELEDDGRLTAHEDVDDDGDLDRDDDIDDDGDLDDDDANDDSDDDINDDSDEDIDDDSPNGSDDDLKS